MEVGPFWQYTDRDVHDARPSISLSRLSSYAALALLHSCLLTTEMFQMVLITILFTSDLPALSKFWDNFATCPRYRRLPLTSACHGRKYSWPKTWPAVIVL
jgi:hypothetical protein